MERPYSRYTREKTWAALYSQHINAGYALVPYSRTNNSIDVVRCDTPDEAVKLTKLFLQEEEEIATWYAGGQIEALAPASLVQPIKLKRWRTAVVLARSSDYYHYRLEDRTTGIGLIVCGLHDSYLLLVSVLEMRTNKRYKPRETAIALTDPALAQLRCTQFGHNILLAAYAKGQPDAMRMVNGLNPRTRRRYVLEKERLQGETYSGRPLAFLTEAERAEVGAKIRAGLKRYHAQRRLRAV